MPPAKERPSPFDKHVEASSSAIAHGFSTVFALGPQPRPGAPSSSTSAMAGGSAKAKGKGAQSGLPVTDAATMAAETGPDWLQSLRDFTGYKGGGQGLRKGAETSGAGDEGEDSDEEDEDEADSPAAKGKGAKKGKKKAGKLDESTAEQRKAQNRIAQREFRQRKQQYIRALEARVELLSSDHDTQVDRLRFGLRALVSENNQLRSMVSSLAVFIGSGRIGGPLEHAGVSREDLEEMIGTTSEKTVTDAWTSWPGAKESEALRQIRLESNLPPEGLPESYSRGPGAGDSSASASASKKRKTADDANGPGRSPASNRASEPANGTTAGNGIATGGFQPPVIASMPAPLPQSAAPPQGLNMQTPLTLPAPIMDLHQQALRNGGITHSMSLAGEYLRNADPGSCPMAIAAMAESESSRQLLDSSGGANMGTPVADAFLASLFGADAMMGGFGTQTSGFTPHHQGGMGMSPTSGGQGASSGGYEAREASMMPPMARASPANSSTAASRTHASPAHNASMATTPPPPPTTTTTGATGASTPSSDRGHYVPAELKAAYRKILSFSSPITEHQAGTEAAEGLKALPGLIKSIFLIGDERRLSHQEEWRKGVSKEQELERITSVAVQFNYHILNFRRNPAYRLPPILRPSQLQQSKPHDPLIDGIPLVRMRDKLIEAQDKLQGDDVFFCLLEHTRLHDGDYLMESSWEVDKAFFRVYPELFDDEELRIINRWRAGRGEKTLTREEVLGK